MASLQHIKNGWQTGYRLRVCTGGKRHSVWLGNVRRREADTVQLHVEAIIQSQRLQTPIPSETQRWIRDLSADLRTRLRPILGVERTVDEAADAYVVYCEKQLKPTTARSNADTVTQFAADYGSSSLRLITGDQIDTWLLRRNVAASTIGKHVKHLRSWFAWALQAQLIESAPTIETPATIGQGEKQFIDFDQWQKVIDHFASKPEMQCVLALSRWCGLRIASELVTLRRSSVDLASERLLIEDSKRSHRQSRGPPVVRKVPLFAGLRPYLMVMLERPGGPHDYLLPTIGGQDAERVGSLLRQRVYRALDKLGLERWPRVFHSLRATRQTQLKDLFGEHAACEWIGNSRDEFRQSYELIPDEIFTRAVDA
jgi:hypothetical protein